MAFTPKSFSRDSFTTPSEISIEEGKRSSNTQGLDIPSDTVKLKSDLKIPAKNSRAIVIFVHGKGGNKDSSKTSKELAEALNSNNISTLLFNLLTDEEMKRYNPLMAQSFDDTELLARRVMGVIEWVKRNDSTKDMRIGLSGSSEGSAAVLIASARKQEDIGAIVSRGGIVNKAEKYYNYDDITAPTLLIVGEKDPEARPPNTGLHGKLQKTKAKELRVIEGASHEFREPGTREQVIIHSVKWFTKYLSSDKDFLPLLQDNPTEEDRLARRPYAKHLATRLRHIYSQDHTEGAFMLHIHGQWGSGKSSLLKLLENELKNGKQEKTKHRIFSKKWFNAWQHERRKNDNKCIVVWFNAWKHERSGPPWWSLMNSVYNESLKQLPLRPALKLRFLENIWRVRNGLSHRFFWPFVIVASIILILLITDTQAFISATKTGNAFIDFIQNKVGLIIATAAAIVSGIFALSTSLAPGSARAAHQFIDTVENPTDKLSSHFEDLRNWIGRPIVVFIDDLDRCQHDYTVELLERIQTLFKDVNVIYVVAADRRWIYTSYNKAYDTFRRSMYESGRPLRFMFLEKIFQLSMNVPPVDPKVKEQFWKYLLSNKTSNPDELANRIKAATQAEEEKFDKLTTERAVIDESKMKTGDDDPITESARRGAAIVRLASLEIQKDIERRLVPFSPLVESNPRLMKRTKQVSRIYHTFADVT